jgi:hypothetical protein
MTIILNKSKILKPNNIKEIRYIHNTEKKVIEMAKSIAKDFGAKSKKQKKKIIFL